MKRHPAEMGSDEVTKFLSYLAVSRHVAASTLRLLRRFLNPGQSFSEDPKIEDRIEVDPLLVIPQKRQYHWSAPDALSRAMQTTGLCFRDLYRHTQKPLATHIAVSPTAITHLISD